MAPWYLDKGGFINHYMVSGPLTEPFSREERDTNQLRYEAWLRSIIAEHTPLADTERITANEKSRLHLPWRFQGGQDTAFVNLSDFYPTMQRVKFDVATALEAPCALCVSAILWSYTAVDVYCNGIRVGGIDHPVYKPIAKAEMTLPLRPGKNILYLACETLGVRDTRSFVGLQIVSHQNQVTVGLPDEDMTALIAPALQFLESAILEKDRLRFSAPAPDGASWAVCVPYEPDYAHAHRPLEWQDIGGQGSVSLQEGAEYLMLRAPAGGVYIQRMFERTEQIRPRYLCPAPGAEENMRRIYRRIADMESLNRGGRFGFPIANMLARKYLGDTSHNDERNMEETLSLIDARVDCADFLMCGLIRYIKRYPVDEVTAKKIKHTMTHFRYWMDQDGFDGMCFWSENHSLMFYACAMQAGEIYPDAFFPLAGMTGRELHAWGRGKVTEWLDDVEKYGFEEFLSTVYTCVTFAGLINVVDFSERALSVRAANVTDRLLRMLAQHTFKGGIIAPQGRVYRRAIYPFQAGALALMNAADPTQPAVDGEGWLGFFATSHYRFPADLKEIMDRPLSISYTTGNARIVLEKKEDWCLTSVQIPREPFTRWENETRTPNADPSSHAFVKSYNECFHGTTCFYPGVYGYQQHLWYAALNGEAILFVNHPGSASEGGDMRPGYWHGNGVFPALKQEGNVLGFIYRIPEEHPLHCIHLYCPECRFDEVRREGAWLLLRKGKGYIGFWSSTALEAWNGMNFHCEQRMWDSETAGLCVCAGGDVKDMAAFRDKALALHPAYDPKEGLLSAEGFRLQYMPGQDDTQYL